jgi:hypothetical protein
MIPGNRRRLAADRILLIARPLTIDMQLASTCWEKRLIWPPVCQNRLNSPLPDVAANESAPSSRTTALPKPAAHACTSPEVPFRHGRRAKIRKYLLFMPKHRSWASCTSASWCSCDEVAWTASSHLWKRLYNTRFCMWQDLQAGGDRLLNLEISQDDRRCQETSPVESGWRPEHVARREAVISFSGWSHFLVGLCGRRNGNPNLIRPRKRQAEFRG